MPSTQVEEESKRTLEERLVKRRTKLKLADLDYKRAIKEAAHSGMITQQEMAKHLGISQPSVSSAIKKAEKVDEKETPFELCQRYSIGELSEEQLVDRLSNWEYVTSSVPDEYDGLLVDQPGTFREVEWAVIGGLIESSVYDTILERIKNKNPIHD